MLRFVITCTAAMLLGALAPQPPRPAKPPTVRQRVDNLESEVDRLRYKVTNLERRFNALSKKPNGQGDDSAVVQQRRYLPPLESRFLTMAPGTHAAVPPQPPRSAKPPTVKQRMETLEWQVADLAGRVKKLESNLVQLEGKAGESAPTLPDSNDPVRIVNSLLTQGAIYSIDVEAHQVRIATENWAPLKVEEKQSLVRLFSVYFNIKTGYQRVTILSDRNDTKLATYSGTGFSGVKILQ